VGPKWHTAQVQQRLSIESGALTVSLFLSNIETAYSIFRQKIWQRMNMNELNRALRAASFCISFLTGLILIESGMCAGAPVKAAKDVSQPWANISWDKRCEGLLAFMTSTSVGVLPQWTIDKPECVIAGGVDGDITWSLDGKWRNGNKILPLRYKVMTSTKQKPKVFWCVIKGTKAGCSTVWANSFTEGALYETAEAAKAAFEGVSKISTGFLSLATKLDEWVGLKATAEQIFDLPYADWVKAWAKSPRSLPTKDGPALAAYSVDQNDAMKGLVQFKGDIPAALRACLGCAKTACESTPISFTFKGLSLTMDRVLSEGEQKSAGMKEGRASWMMSESTPFVGGEAKWAMLCGEHRFNIQKF
jgi:hypothetical protein